MKQSDSIIFVIIKKKLRSEEYDHLKDALEITDGHLFEIGKMVVLQSTFGGGPCYMHEPTEDTCASMDGQINLLQLRVHLTRSDGEIFSHKSKPLRNFFTKDYNYIGNY